MAPGHRERRPRGPLLSDRWRPAFDALGLLAGLGCLLYAIAQVSGPLALGIFGAVLAGSGAFGLYRRGASGRPPR